MKPFYPLLSLLMIVAAKADIPYPAALDVATIEQTSIDHVDQNALIVGNGDLNALIFSRGNEIVMHVSKNDVWDARLDTSKDGPLLKVDVANRTWEGGGKPASWLNPYPTQTPPCVIRIPLNGAIVGTRLDLRRAVASITTTTGTISIRALAQTNVLYIESENAISLEGFAQDFLPAPEVQNDGAITSVKQALPGDVDYKGMTVYSVRESKGNRHAVSVETSRNFEDPLAGARRLAAGALTEEAADVIRSHENTWSQYWSRSGVELGEKDFQNWWYRQLYYFRCLSRPGSYPVGLQGVYHSRAPWHGTWTTNYNAEQTFWPAFSSNHPELAEPFIDLVNDFHPRARWYAKTVFDCDGAVTPHNIWPFEPDPANCKSVNKRQLAYMPWSYGIGTAGHIVSIPWMRYIYTGDKKYLKDKVYPVLKDYALFYESFVEKCKVIDGKVIFGPSVDPENSKFGIDNSPYDLAWARFTLRSAIQAANDLDVDAELVSRWTRTLEMLPGYPLSGAPGEEIIEFLEKDKIYNIVTPVVPLFPAEQASWFSPEKEKSLFKRTIEWIQEKHTKGNSMVMLNVARARLSMTDEAHAETKSWFKSKEQSNGLFHWQGHGFYMTEQTAVAGLINEFLLQSVDNIIRVFPAWPKDKDASFTTLRAQGGFLVTAGQKAGKVVKLNITSTVGGELRLLSPWTDIALHSEGNPAQVTVTRPDEHGIVTLDTLPGQELVFSKAPQE